MMPRKDSDDSSSDDEPQPSVSHRIRVNDSRESVHRLSQVSEHPTLDDSLYKFGSYYHESSTVPKHESPATPDMRYMRKVSVATSRPHSLLREAEEVASVHLSSSGSFRGHPSTSKSSSISSRAHSSGPKTDSDTLTHAETVKSTEDEAEEEEDGFWSGIIAISKDFSEWASCAGLAQIGATANLPWLIFWTSVVVGSTGLMIWQIKEIVDDYYEYEIRTSTSLKFEARPYPAVTICDLNPYSRSGLREIPEAEYLMQAYYYQLRAVTGSIERDPRLAEGVAKFGLGELRDTVALQSKAKDLLVLILSRYNETVRRQLSTPRNGLIRYCRFNGRPCDLDRDFDTVFDPKMGLCHRFNGNASAAEEKVVSRPGPKFGLSLVLLSNRSDYIPLAESGGFRLLPHDPNLHPFPDTAGFTTSHGVLVSAALTLRHIQRLGEPHGECQDGTPEEFIFPGDYSIEGCYRRCFQLALEETCGCSDPNYDPIPSANGTMVEPCDPEDYEQRECWFRTVSSDEVDPAEWYESLEDDEDDKKRRRRRKREVEAEECEDKKNSASCDCLNPCEEFSYDSALSRGLWPGYGKDAFVPGCRISELPPGVSCADYFRQNGAFIDLFFAELNVRAVEEEPDYEIVSVLADFGGQVGLWLGLTVVSGAEFLVYFYLIFSFMAFKGWHGLCKLFKWCIPALPDRESVKRKFSTPAKGWKGKKRRKLSLSPKKHDSTLEN